MATIKYLNYQSNFLKDFNEVKALLIVVAMDVEEQALLVGHDYAEKMLGQKQIVKVKELNLVGRQIIIGRCGVGLVNAAIMFDRVLESYPIDAVVLLGVGGALDESLAIGDTVVAKAIIQHDSIASRDQGNLLIAPGELTLSRSREEQVDPVMRCDDVLVQWLVGALKQSTGRVQIGTLLSGSEFAASANRKKQLRSLTTDALLVDMEAAALAQLARRAQIPFAAAKTVADRAGNQVAVADDYKNFLKAAATHSRAVLEKL